MSIRSGSMKQELKYVGPQKGGNRNAKRRENTLTAKAIMSGANAICLK